MSTPSTVNTLFSLASLAIALFTLPGCNKSDAPTSESSTAEAAEPKAAEPKPVVSVQIGYQKIGAPFLLKSRSKDLDEALTKASAKASWKEFQHGPALLEAINAKEVDIGYVGETPPVFAQAANIPFVYVATDPPAPKSEAIIVRKDSPIKKVEDLKGKKVALNRGSNVQYLLVKALEKVGLKFTDVEVLYLSPGDARPAFDTGKVDAWVIWDPFLAGAELAGARILQDGEGLVDNNLFYVARREFAEKHPEIVQVVLDAFQKLSEWEAKNPEESAKILAESSGVAYEALLIAEKRHSYGVLPITPELLAKQQAIADVFRSLELIPKEIKTAEAFIQAAVYKPAP